MRKKSTSQKDITPAITCKAPWRVTKVKPLEGYKLEVEFVDKTSGLVEMEEKIRNPEAGVFSKLKDITLFNQVYLEHGAVTWPGEIDLAPDAMHQEIKLHGKWILR